MVLVLFKRVGRRGGILDCAGISLVRVGCEVTASAVLGMGLGDIQEEELLLDDQDFELRALIGNGISGGGWSTVLARSVAQQVSLRWDSGTSRLTWTMQ